jgi:hypothetical protein
MLAPLLIGSLDRYGAIAAECVADGITALAGSADTGLFRHDNRAMQVLASHLKVPTGH